MANWCSNTFLYIWLTGTFKQNRTFKIVLAQPLSRLYPASCSSWERSFEAGTNVQCFCSYIYTVYSEMQPKDIILGLLLLLCIPQTQLAQRQNLTISWAAMLLCYISCTVWWENCISEPMLSRINRKKRMKIFYNSLSILFLHYRL